MTVTTTANSIRYAGNGTTTAFAFPYIFFAPSDLVVTLIVTATGANVAPPLILNGAATYDYTVTGVVTHGEYASGGTVTFNTAPITGYTVSLVRAVPALQTVTLIDNTKFPADTVNTEFDYLTVLAQQSIAGTSGVANTALQIPGNESGLVVTAVPAATRANKILLWDGVGNLTTLDPASIIGGAVPAGPAGGDLAGVYPNPTIKPNVNLTGTPTAATAPAGTTTTQLATTAFVAASGFRLIQRTVPAAAQATVDFISLPSDINDLMFTFDVTPTVSGQDFCLRFFNAAGTIDAGANYVWSLGVTVQASPLATNVVSAGGTGVAFTTGILFDYPGTNRLVGNTSGIRGRGMLPNIRDAARFKGVDYQANYLSNDGTLGLTTFGSGYRQVAGLITGLRFQFLATTFAAGGAISLWGSP